MKEGCSALSAARKPRFLMARVLPEGPDKRSSSASFSETASEPTQKRERAQKVARGLKRWLDVSLGIAIGVVALPVMIVIAVAILVDSPGPVLFCPTRVGRRGRQFSMYKFRTMVKDAHERLDELAHLNVADGMVKIPDDPRVTRIGKWLRRFSLDELPQIYNIIAGHMSLVGPRPHDKHELPEHSLEHELRLSVRPGLTGLWQINARSDPSLASRVRYDLLYVSGWSLMLDATILARTVPVVIRGKGGSVDFADRTVSVPPHTVAEPALANGSHAALVLEPQHFSSEAVPQIGRWTTSDSGE